MEVIVASNVGFCFGVKRAINLAFSAAKKNKEELDTEVYTLGPIIHNQQVVKKLEDEGVKVIEDLDKLNTGTVIIRTHGVAPNVMSKIKKRNFKIIDATCPIVERSQKIVRSLYEEGYKVIIIGEKEHPEIKSIKGFTDDTAIVINSIEEVRNLPKFSKIGVVSQTTLAFTHFQEVLSNLLGKSIEFKIYNTICSATSKTQNKSLKLSKEVDIMIVIGGKNSANTRHLAEICKKEIKTYHIEDAKELRKQWFNGKKKVGITAGASTPNWIIDEVVFNIKKL